MRNLLERLSPLRAPEDGGGSGSGGGNADGDAAAAAAAAKKGAGDGAGSKGADAGDGQADGGGGSAPYRPDGLPDHLFDPAGPKGTIDKLWGAYSGMRTRDGARGAVPEKADGYKVEWAEPVKPYAEMLSADPFMGKVRESALKRGIGDKQFAGFMNDILGEMIAGEFVDAPFDPKAERKALVPDSAKNLAPADQEAAIDKRMRDNMAWIEAMKARAPATEKDGVGKALDFLVAELGDRALGHQAIEFLRAQIGAGAQPAGGGQGSGGYTRADLQKRKSDPRSDPMSPKHDPKFVEETERLYKQLIGD